MPRYKLNDRFVARQKATGRQTEYFDETIRGLALRVTPTVKAWTFHYTLAGKRARAPLGNYPAVSLAAARTRALEAKAAIEDGLDPRHTAKPDSLQSVFEEWERREGSALRTIDHRRKAMERLVWPTLGARPIRDIRRSEIVRLLDTVEDERGSQMAEGVLAFLSKLFNWHAARDDDFISPVIRGMGRSKAEARDRILTDDEIRKVWLACEGVYGRYIKFLLLTAVRRNEAAKAEWSEVTNSTWIVPAARMKGKLDHVVPLSPAAIEAMGDRSEGYVFTVTGKRPFNDFDDYKRELDKASGVKGWTLHDLRRTARSLMSRAGVSPDIAERCLAHTIPGVRGVYDRYEYLDEKREALGRLARLVGEIVNG